MNLPTLHWRKSSRSDQFGGECVEVAHVAPAIEPDIHWRKSSRSDDHGGECVEVAELAPMIAVRDSKDPDGPKLTFSAVAWRSFTRRVKASEHDLA